MKRPLMLLLQEVLQDRGTVCRVSTDLDFKRVQARVEHEGLSFLTITLPKYGSDFERSLSDGFVARHSFQGFPWRRGLPVFLMGFLELVFDSTSGALLDDPDITAIQAIRQITLMFGKMNLKCSDAREAAAMTRFVECEQELRESELNRSDADTDDFYRLGRLLWADLFSYVDQQVYEGGLIPKHGPGATADRLSGNRKYDQREWTSRLEAFFPCGEFAIPSFRYHGYLDQFRFLEPGDERPVRVISVPKTQKTPRIIAIEPANMQYCQQALLALISDALGNHDKFPFSAFVGLLQQEPNQLLAMEGSLTGELATLDLSEASDRVSYQLVQGLLANHPHLSGAVDACRSRNADVFGHGIIPLSKFASMGSALCFPFEAIVFSTVVLLGIERARGQGQLTKKQVSRLLGKVRVYGDDIIVSTDVTLSVIDCLELFGFKVNSSKSFWTGKFRESCGKEYYGGHDVSIVRVRECFPTSRVNVLEIVSLVSLRNQFYQHGYWSVCKYLDPIVKRLIPFPIVQETSSVLGRHSFLGFQPQKECPRLHRPLVRGAVTRTITPKDNLDGIGALLKCLLRLGDNTPTAFVKTHDEAMRENLKLLSRPITQSDHLERAGRAYSTDIRIGWHVPY